MALMIVLRFMLSFLSQARSSTHTSDGSITVVDFLVLNCCASENVGIFSQAFSQLSTLMFVPYFFEQNVVAPNLVAFSEFPTLMFARSG